MTTDAQVRHLMEVLALKIRRQRVTRRSIEQRMGWSHGYMTRLMSGVIELKLRHIFDILTMIGVSPAEFFAEVYSIGEGEGGPGGEKVGATREGGSQAEGGELRIVVLTEEQLERRIESVVQRLSGKRQGVPAAEPPAQAPAAPSSALPIPASAEEFRQLMGPLRRRRRKTASG